MTMDITLILRTLTPIVDVLERLAVPYHIGGSVASSLYGEFRPTQDVDLVADMHLAHVRSFVKGSKETITFQKTRYEMQSSDAPHSISSLMRHS